jgi:hypothetical protein
MPILYSDIGNEELLRVFQDIVSFDISVADNFFGQKKSQDILMSSY